jgi:hypothetical protein
MTSSERPRARSAALKASILLSLSLALAVLAVYWFTLPNLIGFSGQNPFAERDFWCVLGSSMCAFWAGVVSFRFAFAGVRPSTGSVVGGVIAGSGLALLLFLLWAQFVLYYALLLAPLQALALIGVGQAWRRHRREASFRRFGFGSSSGT